MIDKNPQKGNSRLMYVNQLEVVPATHPHRQFPSGDISVESFERAREYAADYRDDDMGQSEFRYNHIHRMELLDWRSAPGNDTVFRRLGSLARSWAHKRLPSDEEAENIVSHGIYHTIAFNHITHLLPLNLRGMEDAVEDLSSLDADQIQQFSDTNWAGMYRTHPNVFSVLSFWSGHLGEQIPAVRNLEQEELLSTGVGLPYALAVSKRMHSYLLTDPDDGAKRLIRQEEKRSD